MKAVLWDMDGTLVNTEPLWGIATYELGEALGRPLTAEVRAQTVGGTTPNTVRICAQWAGVTLTDAELDHWRGFMRRRVAELFSDAIPFIPGARELLVALREAHIPLALVTNTARELTEHALDSIGRHWFELTLCSDEVVAGKPDPTMYREAARRLGLAPDDCLVLEDSAAGMTAGRDAGCRVLGLPSPGVVAPDGVLIKEAENGDDHPLVGVTVDDLRSFYAEAGAKPAN